MSIIQQYFPDLTQEQYERFEQLIPLYTEWNSKINVISRADIENLSERHILHSLAIAKCFTFKPEAQILDLGTGGGFPGVPLAIFFPETQFFLVDSIGKKIKVVEEVAAALGLQNITARHSRVEDLKMAGSFDFVVTRAVAPLEKLVPWAQRLLKKKHIHAYPNGLIALKGGDLGAELKALPGKARSYSELFPVSDYFKLPFFEEKSVVYVQG